MSPPLLPQDITMTETFFDSDRAATRCNRMWRKLGGLLERYAYDRASKGLNHAAMEAARMAEVCFWQATGEMDCVSMKDIVPKAEA